MVIEGNNVVAQGKNMVGGLAGLISGTDNNISNVSVNISINSGYRSNTDNNIIVGYHLYDGTTTNRTDDGYGYDYNYKNIYYAGAIAGVVDTTNQNIKNISVYGNSRVIGETIGTAFGLIAENATVNNVSVEIEEDQFIRANKVAGGVVGELRGSLVNASFTHKKDIQDLIDVYKQTNANITYTDENINFFRGTSLYAGGIAGMLLGGSINGATVKVDIRNTSSLSAGGATGAMFAGDIQNVVSYASVLSSKNIGGLVGSLFTSLGSQTILQSIGYLENIQTDSSGDIN